jgi:hypothetical protein
MRENSDDLDLSACLRHARRWMIALLCLLAINGSLVALAFGGFGAAPRREPTAHAAAPSSRPLVAAVPVTTAPPAAVIPVVEPDTAPSPATVTDPPPATPVVVDSPPSDPPPASDPPSPATVAPLPVVAAPHNAVPPALDSLIVANPPDIGGAVHFTVNGVVHTLAPGDYVEFAGRSERLIEYHRGDDFGYAKHKLLGGAHTFALGPIGWTLQPLDPEEARELLCVCRQKTAAP